MDVAGLKASWDVVAHYGDQVPLFFYSTLFLTHPETRELFPVSMANQRDKLVRALGSVVANVDNLDAVLPVVQQLGRDHRKFGVTRDHYPAVGEALIVTLEHFCGPRWDDGLARDWEAAYSLVARVMTEAAEAASGESPPWWEAEVTGFERRTIDVAVLRLTPNYQLPYAAGQSLAVETPQRPRLWRYYSPATMPAADGSFELHVALVPGGSVSTAIVQSTRKGDVLRVGSPVGQELTLAPGGSRDLVLIAGGTGLAPLKALVEELATRGPGRRVQLFWGARRQRGLYDLPALQALADRHAWLRIVPCVSHESPFSTYAEQGSAVEVALKHGSWLDHDAYVCGSPEMVRGTLRALTDAGMPRERVHVEDFGTEETPA